jgi:hypothetical protein
MFLELIDTDDKKDKIEGKPMLRHTPQLRATFARRDFVLRARIPFRSIGIASVLGHRAAELRIFVKKNNILIRGIIIMKD